MATASGPSWTFGRNSLLGSRKKFLMRTFTCRSNFLCAYMSINKEYEGRNKYAWPIDTQWRMRLAASQSTYIGRDETGFQYICPLSWSVHCNFTGEGKCNERGWACTPHPHQPGLILPSSLNVRQKAAVATRVQYSVGCIYRGTWAFSYLFYWFAVFAKNWIPFAERERIWRLSKNYKNLRKRNLRSFVKIHEIPRHLKILHFREKAKGIVISILLAIFCQNLRCLRTCTASTKGRNCVFLYRLWLFASALSFRTALRSLATIPHKGH